MPDRLANYVEVKDRIAQFYEDYEDGRLVTTEVQVSSEPDGVPRVWVQAKAYRSVEDPHPGVGWSWMILPGATNFTRGSELENTETSAWGRALGALGIGIAGGIASAQEVRNKEGEGEREDAPEPTVELLGRVQIAGTLVRGTSQLFQGQWRESPKGHAIGFRLKRDGKDKDIPQVVIGGDIGETLYAAQTVLLDQKVTVKGHLYAVKQPPRQTYNRLIVGERPEDWIQTDELRIPPANPEGVSPLRDPEQDVIPVAEGQVPAFDLVESARLDAEEAARTA